VPKAREVAAAAAAAAAQGSNPLDPRSPVCDAFAPPPHWCCTAAGCTVGTPPHLPGNALTSSGAATCVL